MGDDSKGDAFCAHGTGAAAVYATTNSISTCDTSGVQQMLY